MAEKYLDQSGVSRLLQGVNTFVNNAYKNVFTKMIEVDSYETVDLQPNQITKIMPVVDGPMTINFIAHTKPNAEYELIVDVTPNATITYTSNILWETGEFIPNNFNTVRFKFTTFDSGSVYLAEYTLYSLEDRLLYYSTTDGNAIVPTGLEYTPVSISETQIGDEIYTHAIVLKGLNITLGNAFENQNTLQNIRLPKAIISTNETFVDCSNLTSVIIPDSVTRIGMDTFLRCTKLTSITIPNCIEGIGIFAFSGCTSLKSITINATNVGQGAFSNCNALTDITVLNISNVYKSAFPRTAKNIYITDLSAWCNINYNDYTSTLTFGQQSYMYLNNKLLTDLVIPNDITTIKLCAFYGISVEKIVLHSNVTSIGDYAFALGRTATEVYCKAITPPTAGLNIFHGHAEGCKIYVPSTSVDAYKAASGWSTYADTIVGYDFENNTVVE